MMIRFMFLLALFSEICTVSSAMQCWRCTAANGLTECLEKGSLQTCASNQDVCATVVRRVMGVSLIWKHCMQRNACENERKQNWGEYGDGEKCDARVLSLCRCCCSGRSCNRDETCAPEVSLACPLSHTLKPTKGEVSCSNSNQVGSVCKFSCSEEKHLLYPTGSEDSTCMRDRTWSKRRPCCAERCPPNIPMNVVILGNRLQPRSARNESTIYLSLVRQMRTGAKDVRWAALVYSGIVHEELNIPFGDPLFSMTPLLYRVLGRGVPFRRTVNGQIYTGSALKYVRTNWLPDNHDPREHLDVVIIITEANSNDDLQVVAQEMRKAGIQIYAIFMNYDDREIDMEQLRTATTGTADESQIFILNGSAPPDVVDEAVAKLWGQICSRHICDFVD